MNLRWMGALDMYRKVPTDLMEGTKRGSFLSLFALGIMFTLFCLETRAFLKTEYVPFVDKKAPAGSEPVSCATNCLFAASFSDPKQNGFRFGLGLEQGITCASEFQYYHDGFALSLHGH